MELAKIQKSHAGKLRGECNETASEWLHVQRCWFGKSTPPLWSTADVEDVARHRLVPRSREGEGQGTDHVTRLCLRARIYGCSMKHDHINTTPTSAYTYRYHIEI